MKDECEWAERLYIDGVSYYMNDDGDGYDADQNIYAGDLNADGVTVFEIIPEVNGMPVTDVSIRVDNYEGVVDVSKVEVRVVRPRRELQGRVCRPAQARTRQLSERLQRAREVLRRVVKRQSGNARE